MEFIFLHSTYKLEHDSVWHIMFARGEDGKKYVIKTLYYPYFLIKQSDITKAQEILCKERMAWMIYNINENCHRMSSDGAKLAKIIAKTPILVRKLRDRLEAYSIKTLEADVQYSHRVLIDSGVKYKFRIRDSLINGNTIECSISDIEAIESKVESVADPICYRFAFLDIETYSTSVAQLKDKTAPIIALTFYASHNSSYYSFYIGDSNYSSKDENDIASNYNFIKCRNEYDLISKVINFLAEMQFDKIISYTDFDFDYLITRIAKLGFNLNKLSLLNTAFIKYKNGDRRKENIIKCSVPDIEVIDFAMAYMKLVGEPVFSTLDFIAKKELGIGKIPIDSVRSLWEHNKIDDLVKYNLRDVVILKLLDGKLKILQMYVEPIRRLVGCNSDKIFMSSRIGDLMYLRHVYSKNIALYTKPIFPAGWNKPSYSGAIVFEPKGGRHENVIVFDWSELYPSVIHTFNIGWNTFRSDKAEIGIFGKNFTLNEESWTVSIMQPLREYRKRIKSLEKSTEDKDAKKSYKMLGTSLKVIINSLYGLFGYSGEIGKTPASRFYSPQIAEAITQMGKELEITTKNYLENELGYEVLYGDTDSTFVKCKTADMLKEASDLRSKIISKIHSYIYEKWGIANPPVSIEIDKILPCVLIFSGVKKRYHTLDEVKGSRKDLAELTIQLQDEIGKMILQNKCSEAISTLKNSILKFYNGMYQLDLIMVKGRCSKIGKVKTRNMKAIESAKALLGIDIEYGARFYWIYIKERKVNGVKYSIVGNTTPTLPKHLADTIDKERMCKYVILKPLEKYMNILNVNIYLLHDEIYNRIICQKTLYEFI